MEESEFVVNFSALEKELDSAVEADKKYRRENDAKFRALHQKVATYEEFRDIVLASHLKPLDRKDKAGAPRKQPWNSVASKSCRDPQTFEEMQPQPSGFQPRTALEFSRDWRRLGSGVGEKYSLLVSLGGEALRGIFSAEVGFGLLGELLLVLSQGFRPAEWPVVVGVLDGLSRTSRFGLNVSLLSSGEKGACEELFRKIQKAVDSEAQSDVSHSGEIPPSDATTVSDATELSEDSGSGDQGVETVANDNPHEQLKHLMQVYGIPSSGP
ncbi:coiled-coil domain-containing protein 103 [Sardina pilchardus]|uniref:coiled-coil domain-containing protein 103 n=1 Tax=Sardina pilchardus TaxID=27697 RepID=UPI002E119A4B